MSQGSMVTFDKLRGPETYSLEFFRERGYVRKKCRICGEYFWTVNPDRDICG
ncbi:MAG: hypothetical protein QXF08_05730 [Nitrososphaerota archaeon]